MLDGIKGAGKALPAIGSPAAGVVPPPGLAAERAPVSMEADVGAVVRDMAASPPVNAARVERLRSDIDSGSFIVDPESIADAMIAQEGGPAAA